MPYEIDWEKKKGKFRTVWKGKECEIIFKRLSVKQIAYFINELLNKDNTVNVGNMVLALPKFIESAPWDLSNNNNFLDSDDFDWDTLQEMCMCVAELHGFIKQKKS